MPKIKNPILYMVVFLLVISLLLNFFFIYQNLERNRVVRVVDGDSIQIKDGRRIRMLGIDAPERGRCMADEARQRLIKLTLGKRTRLTDTVTDDYGRTLANVWVGRILVNKILVEEGLAKFVYVSSPYYDEIKSVYQKAKMEKLGIFSQMCKSDIPKTDCVIKGNINPQGVKVYHVPGCDQYKQVIVDEAFGDKWFCNESEAQRAGFRRAAGCPDN